VPTVVLILKKPIIEIAIENTGRCYIIAKSSLALWRLSTEINGKLQTASFQNYIRRMGQLRLTRQKADSPGMCVEYALTIHYSHMCIQKQRLFYILFIMMSILFLLYQSPWTLI